MKLDDFLKFKKVRYINLDGKGLTNKEYELLGVTDRSCIINDNGCEIWVDINNCKPVLDSAENPLQNIEITPKFKVGDKVYKYGETDVKTVLEVFEGGYMRISNYPHRVNHETLCHATPENHALLSKPYPHIEFEQPPKPLTGIELAKKLIAKGHNYLVVDTVIGIRVLTRLEGNTLIDSNNVRLDELDDITPLNDETGEPLTEAVLDE